MSQHGSAAVDILVVVHSIGTLLATIAAWDVIQSIILSGPILGVTGLTVALLSFRGRRPIGFHYGLAAPTVAIVSFFFINFLSWSPSEAWMPVGALATVFSVISIPACVAAVLEHRNHRPPQHPLPLQFGISSLLWTMLFVALFFSCLRAEAERAMGTVVVAGYTIFVWRLIRNFRSLSREPMCDSPAKVASGD
jgi:hypothetical protein